MPFLRVAIALVALFVATSVLANPPIPDDLTLTMRVVSSTDPQMLPGARVVLAFDVSQLGPTQRDIGFFIFTASPIPDNSEQPIRLVEAPDSQCSLSGDDESGNWTYTLSQELPPIGESIECTVELDVLAPAASGYVAQFTAEVADLKDGWDPNPANNNVALLVGRAESALALPVRPQALAALAALIILVVTVQRRWMRERR